MTQVSDNPRIARLYSNVPPEEIERLQRFRAAYPYQQATIDGVVWRYIAGGQSDIPVLILSGALCIAEISWPTIERVAEHYHVIVPDYPAINTMDGLADGIASLLDHEGIERVHVTGGSYGGMVAQVFVRRHPSRVVKLVLSHTLPPDPETSRQLARMTPLFSLMPVGLLRAFFKKRLGSLLPEGDPRASLLAAHFREILGFHLTKPLFLSTYRRAIGYGNTPFRPDDLDDWPGEMLILMTDDDPSTPEPVRQALQALYPRAEVHLFHGTGHATAVLSQDEYISAIVDFLG